MLYQVAKNNAQQNITSLLVHKKNQFIHLIEAQNDNTLDHLFSKIKRDRRHCFVNKLAQGVQKQRISKEPVAYRNELSFSLNNTQSMMDNEYDFNRLIHNPDVALSFMTDVAHAHYHNTHEARYIDYKQSLIDTIKKTITKKSKSL